MKAIKSTRQVTKAMELVSASKMRRAVQNAQQLRKYAVTAWEILQRVADLNPSANPYLTPQPVKRILVILFTSDRGLCGSLNTQLFRMTTQYLQALKTNPSFEKVDFVAVGNKGQQFLRRMKQNVIAVFPALSTRPAFRDSLPITRLLSESYLAGTYDHVVMIYSDFVSPLVQEAVIKVLLPFSKTDLKDMLDSLAPQQASRRQPVTVQEKRLAQYLLEPSPEEVLKIVLPQLTEIQMYQGVLESAASEHSARMVAMRNATDNASSILDDLTLSYNQTRQAGITAELAELSASKAALD